MPIIYKYNRQIVPPAPMVNVIVRSPENANVFDTSPGLVDTGADYTAITPKIFEKLAPLRVGSVYVESFRGEGDVQLLYSVNIEIHEWLFSHVPVIIGSDDYVIVGRDLLNKFDLRLNGVDGKLEILRCAY
jgi:predicted aspartyl protease